MPWEESKAKAMEQDVISLVSYISTLRQLNRVYNNLFETFPEELRVFRHRLSCYITDGCDADGSFPSFNIYQEIWDNIKKKLSDIEFSSKIEFISKIETFSTYLI